VVFVNNVEASTLESTLTRLLIVLQGKVLFDQEKIIFFDQKFVIL
jgi:hypothetical protein